MDLCKNFKDVTVPLKARFMVMAYRNLNYMFNDATLTKVLAKGWRREGEGLKHPLNGEVLPCSWILGRDIEDKVFDRGFRDLRRDLTRILRL